MPVAILSVLTGLASGQGADAEGDVKKRSAIAAEVAARPHPRLLLERHDVERLRVRCGIEGYEGNELVTPGGERFGSHQALYADMKATVGRLMHAKPAPPLLISAAMLHLVTGQRGQRDRYSEFVRKELVERERFGLGDEAAFIALDWCWDAIDAPAKRQACKRLLANVNSLDDPQVVLSYGRLGPRITHLAGALALAGLHPAGTDQADRIDTTIQKADTFIHEYYVPYLNAVGPVPATPGEGVWEQGQAALLLELWQTATGQEVWPAVRDSLGRCCEPYLWWRCDYPGRRFLFARDGGNWYPDWPGEEPTALLPVTTFTIANRLDDASATWFASRLLREPGSGLLRAHRGRFEWIPILYDRARAREIDDNRAPTGRLWSSGFAALRSGWMPGDTIVLFDVGQPVRRSQQHFDAGQFQIYRKGRLTGIGSQDVHLAATGAERGRQGADQRVARGGLDLRGPYDQYAHDTISHNCIMVRAGNASPGTERTEWLIWGGQRVIEDHWRKIGHRPLADERQTGKPIAFATNETFDYAAADLTKSFHPKQVAQWIRQLLLIKPHWLLVIDRVAASNPEAGKTWLLQLPTAPLVDGRPLSGENQMGGRSPAAGIWVLPQPQGWMTIRAGDGEMLVKTLWPTEVRWRIVGGPGTRRKIARGPYTGRSYTTSGPDTFEHWMGTKGDDGAGAWYELGSPTTLGRHFGVSDRWGTLMVQPDRAVTDTVFVHLLAIGDKGMTKAPEVEFERSGGSATIRIRSATGDISAEVTVPVEGEFGGHVAYTSKRRGPEPEQLELPTGVEPAAPLPRRKGGW